MIRAFPQSAPILGAPLAKNLDWPGADDIARKLEKLDPTNQSQIPPEIQKMVQEGKQRLAQLEQENQTLKQKLGIEQQKVNVDKFEAETDRMKAEHEMNIAVVDRMSQQVM